MKAKKPTFRQMMGILPSGIHPSYEGLCFDLDDEHMLDFLEANYTTNFNDSVEVESKKIPAIIHYIWLGPKDFPTESIACVQSFMHFNPHWQFYFWTDDIARTVPVAGMKKMLIGDYDFKSMAQYINLSTNWGEKSDLMRYQIIDDIGGFYVDHDNEAFCSFEPLLKYDLVVCCEEPAYRAGLNSHVLFQNGLFGAVPHHPLLMKVQEYVEEIWHDLDRLYPDNNAPTPSWKVLRRTFDSFTKGVKSVLVSKKAAAYKNLILPTCYFFPNRILSDGDIAKFKKQGVIWSSHKYAGLWADGAWGDIVF